MELNIRQTFADSMREWIGIGKRYTMADVHFAIGALYPEQCPSLRTLYKAAEGDYVTFQVCVMVMSVCPEVRDEFDLRFHGHDDIEADDADIRTMEVETIGMVSEIAERGRDGVFCHQDRPAIAKRGLKVVAFMTRICRRLIRVRLPRAA